MTNIRSVDDTDLLVALRGLRATPPPDFAERVLTRLGLVTETDDLVSIEGPTGPLFVAFNSSGISHVVSAQLVDGDAQHFAALHGQRFGRPLRPAKQPPTGLERALTTGDGSQLAYDLRGLSDFQRAVLGKALEIPTGQMRPYAWVAHQIGRPRAVRAVGTALGRNPIPVLIPCHRVVRSDGKIGNYALGTAMKHALLTAEGALRVEAPGA